jgi:N utilization substance protein B
MASYRHLARIAVMQALFAYEFRKGVDAFDILKITTREFADKLKDTSFAEKLLKGVLDVKEDIEKIIQEEAPEWPLEKIARIDRAILEIGIYEIIFSEDVPPIVAINEGVEIAKSYGDVNSPKFVNGVLSTVMHKYKKDDKSGKEEDNKK